MSKDIVLASSIKRIVPVDIFIVSGKDGGEYGKSRNWDIACERMRNVVSELSDYSVTVTTTREYRFE